MQNWEHLLHIIDTLHSRPEKLNVDISRVRQWALNQHTSLYRQAMLYSFVMHRFRRMLDGEMVIAGFIIKEGIVRFGY